MAIPPEASVNDEVAILFTIGVILEKSIIRPSINAILPQIKKGLIFSVAVILESNNFPHTTPQMVWAAVGIKLTNTLH